MATVSIAVDMPWPSRELSPNSRLHWSAKARAVRQYRHDCGYLARSALAGQKFSAPVDVRLVFHPKTNARRDLDNLIASCKALLDGLSDAIGVDDRHFQIHALMGSKTGAGMDPRVHVIVESNTGST
jgi:crossover junction endodeoxyribonuclease RusA